MLDKLSTWKENGHGVIKKEIRKLEDKNSNGILNVKIWTILKPHVKAN